MIDIKHLVWLDLEMTGLDPVKDCIIEIASIITDYNLETIATGPVLAIYKDDLVLSNMSQWCIKHHGQSGLTERVSKSTITTREAEQQTLDFIKQYVPEDVSPLCGNSITQDRRFLVNEMPQLSAFFHYRNYDVSSVKEMLKRWSPRSFAGNYKGIPVFEKNSKHLALSDIKDSIAELKHYRKYFFKDID